MNINSYKTSLVCEAKAAIYGSNVLEENPELTMLREAKEMMPQWFQMGTSDAAAAVSSFLTKMSPEWFASNAEYEASLKGYTEMLTRMAEYFTEQNYVFGEVINFSVEHDGKINDKAVLAIGPEGEEHVVLLDFTHKCETSPKARTDKNKPQYLLDLILAREGIGKDDATYEVWYLKGKEDKAGSYPPFEIKSGSNIASYNFNGQDIAVAFDTACHLAAGRKDCGNCRVCSLCKGYKTITAEADAAPVEVSSKKQWTADQQRVISHKDGPLAVCAVPGAGKTAVLVERVAELKGKGVKLPNILLLSHTRKAVEELKTRVAKRLNMSAADTDFPVISTLNGWGYSVLKDNKKFLGKLKLASDGQRKAMLKDTLDSVAPIEGVNYANMLGKYGALTRIDTWVTCYREAGEDGFAERYPKADLEGVARVSKALDEVFKSRGFIRFDDQLTYVVKLFTEHPEIAARYAKVHKYVMVDEYQDCNEAQDAMVEKLTASHGNIVVVGDDDQSIYKFRGGSNRFLIEFAKNHPSVYMTDNFRTNTGCAEIANRIIRHNADRLDKTIVAHKPCNNNPVLMRHASDERIAAMVKSACKRYGADNVAVIARTNPALEKFALVLDEAGVDHTSPKDYLVDDKVFGVLRDVLKVGLNGGGRATESFARLYQEFVAPISFFDAAYDEAFLYGMNRTGQMSLSVPEIAEFRRKLCATDRILKHTKDCRDIVSQIFDVWFEEDAPRNATRVLEQLMDLVEESGCEDANEILGLFNSFVSYDDATRVDYDYKGCVKLLTAHDSKGKEFDSVFVLSMDNFIDRDDPDESFRLLYVAMTRAKGTLVMSTDGNENEQEILELLGDKFIEVA